MKKILIVDDNAALRRGLRAFLSHHAQFHVCGEASNGVRGIAAAEEERPDLILLDLSMPGGMNGAEAATVIKRILPSVRIVVFTLYPDLIGDVMAKASGIDLVVCKTEGAAKLVEALQPLFAN